MLENDYMSDFMMNKLVEAILEGDSEESVSQVKRLSELGLSSERIVIAGVESAMSALDGKCTLEQFDLLEIMLAGRAVTEVMKFLHPGGMAPAGAKGKVVLATLEGDIHDLGKNILKMILVGKGYYVVDCGRDCALRKLIDTVEMENPLAVGVSGLITLVMPKVRQVREQLALRGLHQVKVMAGGAALKQSTPETLNVDFVADSAFEGLRFLEGLAGSGK